MSFKQATTEAPASASFISYTQSKDSWVIVYRRSDGILDVCANLSSIGYAVFISGVADRGLSLWEFDSQQFICGDVGQLDAA